MSRGEYDAPNWPHDERLKGPEKEKVRDDKWEDKEKDKQSYEPKHAGSIKLIGKSGKREAGKKGE